MATKMSPKCKILNKIRQSWRIEKKKRNMASIRVRCKGGTFSGISGRVGDFVFRAYSDETMLVFYQPRKKKGEKDLSRMDREWTEDESIMARFEELAKMFGLVVVKEINNE